MVLFAIFVLSDFLAASKNILRESKILDGHFWTGLLRFRAFSKIPEVFEKKFLAKMIFCFPARIVGKYFFFSKSSIFNTNIL